MAARPGGIEITLVFVAVACVCTLVEAVARGASLAALAAACGGATALGLLHGLAWSAAILLPARAGPRWRRIGWAAIGLAIALLLPATLGAWDKLGTRSHMLAVVALVGSIVAGVLVGVVAGGFGAVDERGEPRWLSASTRARRGAAGVLVLVAIAATLVDRLAFTGLHATAHTALRSAELAGLAFAIVLWARPQIVAPWDRRGIVLALGLALVPFVVLHDGDDPELAAVWSSPFADEGIGTLRRLGDVDGDGASSWLGGGDCAPWDPDVHPAAVEVPDNGIDDNCRDGDASTHAFAIAAIPVPDDPSPRSILLVTIETLRADRMGLYGHTRDTTPALVARAADARVFDRAYTAGAWTSIAIPTLMRGVQARRMRWQPFTETTRGRLLAPEEPLVASDDERAMQVFMLPKDGPPPLAWWLQRRGMTTAAIVDDRFSELLDPSVGTAIGFDEFVDADQIRGRDPDDRVVDLAIATLRGLPRDRPRFVWVHLFGPHSPNTTHEGTPSFGDGIADGYDHEIRFVDAQLDRLLDAATR
ncbi:MAG TPA: sulfatase-like hydrolase/transferase, partial [Nannocystaceae bacterium]|nr:sulfatase-like hydrolase/transferase [Nannocystaceae bacterium]